ncbi:hypothetical protein ACHAWF_018646 [Thalassiosira exigua]
MLTLLSIARRGGRNLARRRARSNFASKEWTHRFDCAPFSTVKDDDDLDVESDRDATSEGDDSDEFKSLVERLKMSRPDSATNGAEGIAKQVDRPEHKMNILGVMESSPFETPSEPPSSPKYPSAAKGNESDLNAEDNASSRDTDDLGSLIASLKAPSMSTPDSFGSQEDEYTSETKHDATPVSDLSHLMQSDIFTKSWSEPDREGTKSPASRTSYRHGGSNNYLSNDSIGGGSQAHENEIGSHTSKDSWQSTNYQSSPPLSPIEIEYNELLGQTNELLSQLSEGGSSSTLQLMDFDKVMTQWSRFHSKVDNDNVEVDQFGGGFADKNLKQQASDQCTKLLVALEDNYDRLLHHALPTVSASGLGFSQDLPKSEHSQLMPNAASYNLTLHALAHSERGQHVAQEAYSILIRMLERCKKYLDVLERDEKEMGSIKLPLPPFEPTIITFNSVIHAIAKSKSPDAGHLAEEAFAKMNDWKTQCDERNSMHGSLDEATDSAPSDGEELVLPSPSETTPGRLRGVYMGVLPNSRTLACVIDAWANATTTQQLSFAPDRAEAILDLAIKRWRDHVNGITGKAGQEECFGEVQEGTIESVNEDDIGFTLVDEPGVEEEIVDDDLLQEEHIITTNVPVAPQQEEARSESIGSIPALKPNTVAFNSAINAWVISTASKGREAALRAQQLLSRLEALSESDEFDLPDGQSEIIDDGDYDMDSSLKPNVRSYSMVMNAWANLSGLEGGTGEEAASHCENILDKMEARGAIDALVRPNLVSYVTSISAWARANHVGSASRAENILNRMVDLYYNDDAELPSIEGDVEGAHHDAPFNSVITAYARSSDTYAPDRAMAVLQRLESLPMISATTTTYNSVLDCCAKHGDSERALEIFERMNEKSIMKDHITYATVLNAFAKDKKDGAAERAYEFLCRLEEERLSGDSDFIPSSSCYTTVITSYARASGNEDGGIHVVKKAKAVYEKLVGQVKEGAIHGGVDNYASSCFINCCANIHGTRREKKQALIMAITAFEDMKKQPELHGEPNRYTFGIMMKASNRLSSDGDERHRLLESLFAQACKRGCLSRAVLGQFLRNTPSHLSAKAILSLGGSMRDIPESWHRNVPPNQVPTPPGSSTSASTTSTHDTNYP